MTKANVSAVCILLSLLAAGLTPSPAEAGCKWVSRGFKSYLKCTGDIAKAAGKVTETVQEKVGKPVGKGAEHLAHEVGKVLDKTGREIGNAGRDINRYAIENPEDVVAIVAVATVAWAACVDGCTLVGSLLIDGGTAGGTAGGLVAIPLIAIEGGEEKQPEESARLSQPSEPSESNTPTDDNNSSYESKLEEEYPHKYSSKDHPSPEGMQNGIPIVTYRSLDERLGEIFNEFAPPGPNVAVRYPDPEYDAAGGTFLSPRSTNDEGARAAFGDDARRIHAATDFLMFPGQPVFATLTGVVDGDPWEPKPGVKAVNIRSQDGTVSRILYIHPNENIKNGATVKAGETVLGRAADLSKIPAYKGVPNHVHVDYTDFRGRRFDPWSNVVTELAPGSTAQKR